MKHNAYNKIYLVDPHIYYGKSLKIYLSNS